MEKGKINPCLPDRHVQKEILVMMAHHEGFIKEDCCIGDVGDCDQVPDNVLEHVMRTPNLDQVLCLLWGQVFPLTR